MPSTFRCKSCKINYNTEVHLTRYRQDRHGPKLMCRRCHMCFPQKRTDNMRRHLNLVHQMGKDVPLRAVKENFTCPFEECHTPKPDKAVLSSVCHPEPTPDPEPSTATSLPAPTPDPERPTATSLPAPLPNPERPTTTSQPASTPDPERPTTTSLPAPLPDPERPTATSLPAPTPDPERPTATSLPAPTPDPDLLSTSTKDKPHSETYLTLALSPGSALPVELEEFINGYESETQQLYPSASSPLRDSELNAPTLPDLVITNTQDGVNLDMPIRYANAIESELTSSVGNTGPCESCPAAKRPRLVGPEPKFPPGRVAVPAKRPLGPRLLFRDAPSSFLKDAMAGLARKETVYSANTEEYVSVDFLAQGLTVTRVETVSLREISGYEDLVHAQ